MRLKLRVSIPSVLLAVQVYISALTTLGMMKFEVMTRYPSASVLVEVFIILLPPLLGDHVIVGIG